MRSVKLVVGLGAVGCLLVLGGCSDEGGDGSDGSGGGNVLVVNPLENPEEGPAAGNPDGNCDIPAEAGLEDISSPDVVVGTGTPESCTGDAFIDAVAQGGVITFDCGPDPVTIELDRPAKVFNDTGPDIVIDGEGDLKVARAGGKSTMRMPMSCSRRIEA